MIVIIGAGLAGLTAGRALLNAGCRDFLICEREAQVGGRVATETDGEFLFDVGFAVLNPAYPMVAKYLSLPDLGLQYFDAGALLLHGEGQRSALFDPLSHPERTLSMIAQNFPSWPDRLRTLALRLRTRAPQRPRDEGITALEGLRSVGFSELYIEKFFRPFFAGVFLDRDLSVSDDLFRYLFDYFRQSRVALPAGGINAVATNLASSIPTENIRFGVAAESIEHGKVSFSDGTVIHPRETILAVDARAAASLIKQSDDCAFRSVTTAYFAAESLPWQQQRLLALNSSGKGWVNHLAVLSGVQPSYAKQQRHLVAVSGVGPLPTKTLAQTQGDIRRELAELVGREALDWEFLRMYPVDHALPVRFGHKNYESGALIYAGDYLENPSIQGAMLSGEKSANLALLRRNT
jgi:phytoene dehydrogenase-like protein